MDNPNFGETILAEGFKIPDFHYDASFPNLRSALESRESHKEIFEFLESLKANKGIPSTFDGENPEIAFGNLSERLLIGNQYSLPNQDGDTIVGRLKDVAVNEDDYSVFCVFEETNGNNVILKNRLSAEEILAYNTHPDTFFGIEKRQNRRCDDPVSLYDFLYESYYKTPREKLLKHMQVHPDYEELMKLNQEELAKIYCERLVDTIFNNQPKNS